MKATRKLIPAFAMLLIAAVMMSTATFAWFSTNSEVQVNDFKVTAKADTTFIVVSKSAGQVDNKETQIGYTDDAKALIPAKATITGSSVKWETGTGTSISDGTAAGALTDVTDTKDSYVLANTFYIRTANGFPSATNLKLKTFSVTSTSAFKGAVSIVLVVKGYDTDGTTSTTVAENYTDNGVKDTVLSKSVPSSGDVIVEAYIYINGEHSSVITNNATATNLVDMEIDLVFSVG